MSIGPAARLGVAALVLAAVAACGPPDDARPGADADAAVPSYAPPEGAPGFCTRLASAGELRRLPTSIGTLVAGPDVEARTQLSQAMRELRTVLADVRAEGGSDGLAAALEELADALGAVVVGPLTEPVRISLSAGLAQVGALAQPACGFPT